MSCALGRAQSPMALRFWLPNLSTCDAIIMMWRRPDHTTSNTRRYGIHASSTSSSRRDDTDGVLAMRAASPSVSTRSGEKVSRANRAPIWGTVPKGLAMTSPSPRHAWAHATAQTSARVTSVPGIGGFRHGGAVAGLVDLEVVAVEGGPGVGIGGRRRIGLLEGLGAVVVGWTRREMGAAGR